MRNPCVARPQKVRETHQPLLAVLRCSMTAKSRNQADPSHREKRRHHEGLEGKASQENLAGAESELTPIIGVAERGCDRRRDEAIGNRWQVEYGGRRARRSPCQRPPVRHTAKHTVKARPIPKRMKALVRVCGTKAAAISMSRHLRAR